MPQSLCWKTEYTDYLREIAPGRLTPEVTVMINTKFGTNYTKTQIGGVRKRLGLTVGKAFRGRSLNKQQHDYFVEKQFGRTAKEMADLMNSQFGLSLTASQVKTYRNNHKLHSGLTGHFPRGHIPANKGKKCPGMVNSGQFQKGHLPRNHMPVGAISYTTDGYPKIKVAEPNKWEYLHRQTWEKHHGPVPKGHSVVFLDGDKTNWDISNLACLSKNEVARMNQNHLFTDDPKLTKAGIGLTRLKNRVKKLTKEVTK